MAILSNLAALTGIHLMGLASLATVMAITQDVDAGYAKRGFGSGDPTRIDAVNSNWYYNWGASRGTSTAMAEFVPMIWGAWAATDSNINAIRNDPTVTTVLGFNEPERPDQANMTVTAALDAWPKLMQMGKRLVSPAPSDTSEGRAWLQSFMSGAATRGYQVDAVAFHWYGDIRQPNAAQNFLNAVSWYHTTFNKPVWITEFAGMDWWNNPNQPVTMAMNLQFMQQVLPQLDSRAYVERYAWWNWSAISNLVVDPLPLTTTSLGDYWTGTTIQTGQTFDLQGRNTGNDIYYLKGGTVTDSGPSRGDFMRRLDAVSGTSTISGGARWEVRDMLLRVRSGATLRKTGTNIIALNDLSVTNDGIVSIQQGSLQFENGATSSGSGTYLVEPDGTLSFSSIGAASGNSVSNSVELRGGTVRSLNVVHTISGSVNALNASTIDTVGQLDLTGTLAGSATILKTGTGVLRITNRSASSYSGAIHVQEGMLYLDKFGSNVTGTGRIDVGPSGTLAGAASISGATHVAGTLSPGAAGSTDSGELRFTSVLTLLPTATTVVDLKAGSSDRIMSTQLMTIDGQLNLRAAAGFDSPYLEPIVVLSGASMTGRFDGVAGMIIHPDKAFAVIYTNTQVSLVPAIPGDASLDGKVDFDDLLILAQNYQTTGGAWTEGDFNGDTSIDFNDLLSLAQHYNSGIDTPLSAGVVGDPFMSDWALARSLAPEPGVLALLSAIGFVTRRNRV